MSCADVRGADRIVQACVLAAVAVPPVFFNAYSLRSFEADKTVVLCLLALAGLVAWAGRRGDGLRLRDAGHVIGALRGFAAAPLVILAFLVLVSHGLATVWSIDPLKSLLGSYFRFQGVGAMAAYFVLFLILAVGLRSRRQAESFVTAMLLASLAVGLYGIFQHLGVDPIVWQREGRSPARSTLGALGFVAGFLCITAPLTVYRLVAAVRTARSKADLHVGPQTALLLVTFGLLGVGFATGFGNALLACALSLGLWWYAGRLRRRPPACCLQVWVYAFILAVHLTAIILTQSRTGLLTVVLGAFVFAWLWSVATERRRTSLILASGATILAVTVGLAALGNRAPQADPVSQSHAETARSALAIPGNPDSVRVRVLLWQGVVDLVRSDPVRALFGHGPETLRLAMYPHFDPEISRLESSGAVADRAHNETYDVLVSVGLTGLLIYVVFWIQLLLSGHRRIGAVHAGDSKRFSAYCCAGAALFAAPAVLVDDWTAYAGIVLPLGLLAGAGAYVLRHRLVGQTRSTDRPLATATADDALLAIALLTAVTAYLLSSNVDVSSVANRAYFWIAAGLLAAMTAFARAESASQRKPASLDLGAASAADAIPLVCALIVLTLLHGFGFASGAYLADARILWLPLLVFVAAGVLTAIDAETPPASSRSTVRPRGGVGLSALWTVAAVAFYLTIYALTAAGPYHPGPVAYIGSLAATLLLWSTLPLFRFRRSWRRSMGPGVLGGSLIVIAGAFSALTVLEADVRAREGYVAEREGRFADAARSFAAASALAPYEGRYKALHAGALLAQAAATTVAPSRGALLASAEDVLERAVRMHPRDPDHAANLARLHAATASMTPAEDAARRERLQQALASYRGALLLDPNNPGLWIESAWTLGRLGSTEEALRGYRKALRLDPTRCGEVVELSSQLDPERAAALVVDPSSPCGRPLDGAHGVRGAR